MNLANWTPIIIALIGALASVYAVWRARKREEAEASEKISAAWEKLVAPLEERVTALERDNEMLRTRERILWNYIDELRRMLQSNNIDTPALPTLPRMEDR